MSDAPAWRSEGREHEYPDVGPECCVEGCEHHVAGVADGYEPSTREGVACNHCWDFLDEHGHWRDDRAENCQVCADEERWSER